MNKRQKASGSTIPIFPKPYFFILIIFVYYGANFEHCYADLF